MSRDTKELSEAVRTAREAVAELDEPLKTEAFKILLEKLIGGSAAGPEDVPGARKKRARARPSKSKGSPRVEAKGASSTSSLKLDVAELKALKTYCERFELQGSEQIAFVLANFAREHTKLECVTPVDIAYLYRQLVSQRVKVPAVNDVSDWARALNWLAAPSRRKEWLEKSGAGHVVSNSGLLRFHEMEQEAATQQKARNTAG